MITHRTNELIHNMMKVIENILPRDQITYMLLGEHTRNSAYNALVNYDSITDPESRIITVGDPSSFHLSHFYPVLPIEYVVDGDRFSTKKNSNNDNNNNNYTNKYNNNIYDNNNSNNYNNNNKNNNNKSNSNINAMKLKKNDDENVDKDSYHPLFVMQGNFGGKHAHRKDPIGTLNCLRNIEEKIRKEKKDTNVINNIDFIDNNDKILKTNNISESHSNIETHKKNRKKRRKLRKRIHINEERFLSEKSIEIDDNELLKSDKLHGFNPSEHSLESVNIDLIGHLNGKVEVGTLRTGAVRFLSDLSSKDYYSSISQVSEMEMILIDADYLSSPRPSPLFLFHSSSISPSTDSSSSPSSSSFFSLLYIRFLFSPISFTPLSLLPSLTYISLFTS